MKYKIGLFTILTFVLSVTSRTSNPACIPLRYRKPIENKPDLLVVQYIDQAFNGLMWFNGICRMGSRDESATLITTVRSLEKNLYAVDAYTRELYIGYKHDVKKVLLDVDEDKYPVRKFLPSNYTEGSSLESMAVDWVTANLYVSNKKFVKVINLWDKSKPEKIIYTFKNVSHANDFSPTVKVFANIGYLIVQTCHGEITRFNLDGSDPLVLYNNSNVRIESLALDYYEHKVYWTEEDNSIKKINIRYTNLNGDEPKTAQLGESYESNGVGVNLALDDKYVYYVTQNVSEKTGSAEYSLFRAVKTSGEIDEDFEITNTDSAYGNGNFKYIMVLSGEPQFISENHPCRYDNGGCVGYCFGIPGDKKLTKKCDNEGIGFVKRAKGHLPKIFKS